MLQRSAGLRRAGCDRSVRRRNPDGRSCLRRQPCAEREVAARDASRQTGWPALALPAELGDRHGGIPWCTKPLARFRLRPSMTRRGGFYAVHGWPLPSLPPRFCALGGWAVQLGAQGNFDRQGKLSIQASFASLVWQFNRAQTRSVLSMAAIARHLQFARAKSVVIKSVESSQ